MRAHRTGVRNMPVNDNQGLQASAMLENTLRKLPVTHELTREGKWVKHGRRPKLMGQASRRPKSLIRRGARRENTGCPKSVNLQNAWLNSSVLRGDSVFWSGSVVRFVQGYNPGQKWLTLKYGVDGSTLANAPTQLIVSCIRATINWLSLAGIGRASSQGLTLCIPTDLRPRRKSPSTHSDIAKPPNPAGHRYGRRGHGVDLHHRCSPSALEDDGGHLGPAQDDQGSVLGTRDAEGTTIEASDGARGGMGATGDEHQGSGDGRERERWKRRLPKAVHQLRRVVTTASTEVTALPPPSPPSSLPVAAAIVAADYDGSAAAIKPSPHHIAHQ
ncbi:hypothetical protein B0H16DRAFT_1685404 [Mycena metata]|uniref:Uncharacterized protein n=1 Tax=Mycena metata TaxID=1033252 RepID=A0AAD7NRP5_9AGAR|nr:hypothetical protein B0H16DRAFT_1685404 [Mycena metata]